MQESQIRGIKSCEYVKQISGNVEQYIKDYPSHLLLPEHIDDFYISQIKQYGILGFIMSTKGIQTILGNGYILYPLHDIHIYKEIKDV